MKKNSEEYQPIVVILWVLWTFSLVACFITLISGIMQMFQ
jgi:hypothetical protein